MKKDMGRFKESITTALDLPLDVALDLPKIEIIGDVRINITNHKGIIEYTNDLIRINSKIGMIKITGQGLEIKNVLMEEISINGLIEKVEIIR
ncbi:MAG: sporulation protein YqfC [Tissierellia bacterium]|nr:sporulation protein YqfC [Tissierellia bacterium]